MFFEEEEVGNRWVLPWPVSHVWLILTDQALIIHHLKLAQRSTRCCWRNTLHATQWFDFSSLPEKFYKKLSFRSHMEELHKYTENSHCQWICTNEVIDLHCVEHQTRCPLFWSNEYSSNSEGAQAAVWCWWHWKFRRTEIPSFFICMQICLFQKLTPGPHVSSHLQEFSLLAPHGVVPSLSWGH